jgi:hypothetical protein
MRASWLAVALGCLCCGARVAAPGDAGSGADAGSGLDAGSGADGGLTPDGGRADGGASPDGGNAGGPRLGAHAFAVDAYGNGHSVLSTPAVQTQPTGSTFLAVIGYHQVGTISDNKGNAYVPVGTPITFSSEAGSYFAAFACASCAGGPGHTISFTKAAGDSTDEATLMVIEVAGGSSIDAFVQADSFANPITAGSVATTRAGDLLFLAVSGNSFSSPDNYGATGGFTLLDQDTNGTNSMAGADAYLLAGAPGAYTGALQSSATTASGGSAAFLIAVGR